MPERNPFEDENREPARTEVSLSGPNVKSTLEKPPRPDAVEAQKAALRKHLRERRSGTEHPESP